MCSKGSIISPYFIPGPQSLQWAGVNSALCGRDEKVSLPCVIDLPLFDQLAEGRVNRFLEMVCSINRRAGVSVLRSAPISLHGLTEDGHVRRLVALFQPGSTEDY